MSDDLLPLPDQAEGTPHPRHTPIVYGHEEACQQILRAVASGRLHSGWLIHGPKGIGKATLAWKIAQYLLAAPVGEAPWGNMSPSQLELEPDHPDARLVQSGAHPRLYVVRRAYDEKAKRLKSEITVDTVRGLKSFFHMSSADGGRRVVIVDCADEMNKSAANAILKELEEPPLHTVILLISHQPSRLLPTIRSRCRSLRCAPLSRQDFQHAFGQALEAGGLNCDEEAYATLHALSDGSVGRAAALYAQGGLALYEEWLALFQSGSVDKVAVLKLADSCAGAAQAPRFSLWVDLIDIFLMRVARCAIFGPPDILFSKKEAEVLVKLSGGQTGGQQTTAQEWAHVQQQLSERLRHGQAVNIESSALVLDAVLKIEAQGRKVRAL